MWFIPPLHGKSILSIESLDKMAIFFKKICQENLMLMCLTRGCSNSHIDANISFIVSRMLGCGWNENLRLWSCVNWVYVWLGLK